MLRWIEIITLSFMWSSTYKIYIFVCVLGCEPADLRGLESQNEHNRRGIYSELSFLRFLTVSSIYIEQKASIQKQRKLTDIEEGSPANLQKVE